MNVFVISALKLNCNDAESAKSCCERGYKSHITRWESYLD